VINDVQKYNRFVVCLLLSIAYAASIGGVTTLIGTPPNAIFASLAYSIAGDDITFSQWLLIGLPIGAICLFITWQYMIRFGSKITDITQDIFGDKNAVKRKLSDLGKMSRDEKLVALVFVDVSLKLVICNIFKTCGSSTGDYLARSSSTYIFEDVA
jgi:sodium-dependent dicarboxylate transporter 2/3/5